MEPEQRSAPVGRTAYLAFFMTIIFFSGLFSTSTGWWRVFGFTVLNGTFGKINAAGRRRSPFAASAAPGPKRGSCSRWNWHRR